MTCFACVFVFWVNKFVSVDVVGEHEFLTDVIKNTLEPHWNKSFEVRIYTKELFLFVSN